MNIKLINDSSLNPSLIFLNIKKHNNKQVFNTKKPILYNAKLLRILNFFLKIFPTKNELKTKINTKEKFIKIFKAFPKNYINIIYFNKKITPITFIIIWFNIKIDKLENFQYKKALTIANER